MHEEMIAVIYDLLIALHIPAARWIREGNDEALAEVRAHQNSLRLMIQYLRTFDV